MNMNIIECEESRYCVHRSWSKVKRIGGILPISLIALLSRLLWEISESSEGQIKSTNSLVVFLVSDPPGDWRPPLAVAGNHFLMNVCFVALVVCGRVLHCLWDQLLSLDLDLPNLNSSLIINLICFWFCHNVFAQHYVQCWRSPSKLFLLLKVCLKRTLSSSLCLNHPQISTVLQLFRMNGDKFLQFSCFSYNDSCGFKFSVNNVHVIHHQTLSDS